MSLSFPTSPTVGQLYPSPAIAGTPQWKWDGSEWVISNSTNTSTLNQFEYTGLTTCTGADNNGNTLAYTPGRVEVFLNGRKLLINGDYTATNGTSVVLLGTINATDIVTIVAFSAVSVANTLAPSNNLSDVQSPSQALVNLGPGSAWTPYTPTVAASAGALTTASASGRYKQIGKTIFFVASATITNVGTGSGRLLIGLPFAVGSMYQVVSGIESQATGKSLVGALTQGATTAVCVPYDNSTNLLISGTTFNISGVYESA